LPEAVYLFAINFCRSKRNVIASIQNKTFFEAIKNWIEILRTKEVEEFKYFTLDESLVRSFTIQQMDMLSALDKWFPTDDNFIGAYFEKQFSEELSSENQEMWSS
jgi:hypothetical protein